jgi:hypothetical protein
MIIRGARIPKSHPRLVVIPPLIICSLKQPQRYMANAWTGQSY